jgi:hypothetical protein
MLLGNRKQHQALKKSARKIIRLSFLCRLATVSMCLYGFNLLFIVGFPSNNTNIANGLLLDKETIRAASSLSQNHPPQETNVTQHVPAKNRILYVHVGKTGGEFVKAQLQVSCKTRKNRDLKRECQDRFADGVPSTQVSQQTVGYLHVDSILYPRNAIPLATHYMYTLRNPLDRVISWYIYNHPWSCDRRDSSSPSCQMEERPSGCWGFRFFQCFPTVESFASEIDPSKPNNDKCNQIAWQGIHGQAPDKELNHLLWNYKVSAPANAQLLAFSSFRFVSHSLALFLTCLVLLEQNIGDSSSQTSFRSSDGIIEAGFNGIGSILGRRPSSSYSLSRAAKPTLGYWPSPRNAFVSR